MSNTSNCITWHYLSSSSFILLAAGLAIINIIVVCGNVLVVLAACTSVKLQQALTSTFVVSLAVSDLLLGLLVLPFSITYQVLLKHWVFSSWWCQIWLAVDVWTCTASILNLVVISFDRYLSLRYPLKYPKLMSRSRARVLVACVWLLASAISLPTLLKQLMQASIDSDNESGSSAIGDDQQNSTAGPRCLQLGSACTIAHSTAGYIIYSALGSFFLPFLVMMYFYLHICAAVHRTLRAGRRGALATAAASQQQQQQHGQLRVHRGGGGGGQAPASPATKSTVCRRSAAKQREKLDSASPSEAATQRKPSWTTLVNIATKYTPFSGRYGRELKAARMLAIICVTFVGCWAPFFSVYLSGAFCVDCVTPLTYDICFWLGYINSALNPFIYALFSVDYRRAFKTLVLRRKRRRYRTIRRLARGGLKGIEVVTAAQNTAATSA